MAMPKALLAFLLIIFALCVCFTDALMVSETPTAYEMLEKFNFPKGILPQGVESYVLNKDGGFEVLMNSDCEFKLVGGYQLKYKKKITGKVVSGSLNNLGGVSVKILFAWFNINAVVSNGNELNFFVGPLSASFAVSNFIESPQCGCGFDCNVIDDGLSVDS